MRLLDQYSILAAHTGREVTLPPGCLLLAIAGKPGNHEATIWVEDAEDSQVLEFDQVLAIESRYRLRVQLPEGSAALVLCEGMTRPPEHGVSISHYIAE